tara:strand:- start:72 stop:323 length:252 start_codon:yes stop_codon:yes gene_type:complete
LKNSLKNNIMVSIGMVELVIGVAVILATAGGLYMKLSNECTKIKSRVHYLEQYDLELKTILADISARLHSIEIILAANQIKDK